MINQEMNDYISKPTSEGLPGTFLEGLVTNPTIDPGTICEEDGTKKNSQFEMVVAVEINPRLTTLEILPRQFVNVHSLDLQRLNSWYPDKNPNSGITSESILTRAKEFWDTGWHSNNQPFDPKSSLGREFFIESLVTKSAGSTLSEAELSRQMASAIGSVYTTDAEKYDMLSALSVRLYRNYNTSRNPGYNNSTNNPNNVELPAGDLSLNQMLSAAAAFNEFQGGVCNDITEVVTRVGQDLFPDKDVLAVNSGSHFGVVVTDGKTHRVIDGGDQLQMTNQLMLDPALSSTNLRISKMDGGALREIAVVDTQMGQVTEAAFQTGKTLLKTDADISSIMSTLKKGNFGVTAGAAQLADSQVVIVVAKYENVSDRWRTYVGAGATAQDFSGDMANKYQVHFRAGLSHEHLRFVNPRSDLRVSSGVRLGGMYTIADGRSPTGGVERVDLSANLDLYNRVDFRYQGARPNSIRYNASLEVEHTLGPTNWGNTTGALSRLNGGDTGTILRNINFHLNQVNVQASAEKLINPNMTAIASAHYQGSNIGQMIDTQLGLQVQAPRGATLLFFTGYTNSQLKGYQTQHSLLGTPSGVQMGVNVRTRSGIEFGTAVRGISGGGASINGRIRIPLGKKK